MDILTLFQATFFLGTIGAIAAITTNALFDAYIRNLIFRGWCPLD